MKNPFKKSKKKTESVSGKLIATHNGYLVFPDNSEYDELYDLFKPYLDSNVKITIEPLTKSDINPNKEA